VQAILRRCGRGPDTQLTVLSDGEDGLRGVVGWFRRKCEHRLEWFPVSRHLENIRKELLYLPARQDFGCHLAFHSRNLDSVKYRLWNDGVERAEWGMTEFRIGLFQHAGEQPKDDKSRFHAIESKLDELRSYLYAHREATCGYAHAFRNQQRVSDELDPSRRTSLTARENGSAEWNAGPIHGPPRAAAASRLNPQLLYGLCC